MFDFVDQQIFICNRIGADGINVVISFGGGGGEDGGPNLEVLTSRAAKRGGFPFLDSSFLFFYPSLAKRGKMHRKRLRLPEFALF